MVLTWCPYGCEGIHMDTTTLDPAAVSAVVREALQSKGISTQAVSRATNIPRSTLLRRLNGEAFKVDELATISPLIEMPVSLIIARAELHARAAA